jgi:hypothetical protein
MTGRETKAPLGWSGIGEELFAKMDAAYTGLRRCQVDLASGQPGWTSMIHAKMRFTNYADGNG